MVVFKKIRLMWQLLPLIKAREPELQTDYDLDCTRQDTTTSSRGKRVYIFPKHPDWFWSLPSFLFSGCQERLPWGKAART